MNLWISLGFNMKVLIMAVLMAAPMITPMMTLMIEFVIMSASWLNSAWKWLSMAFIIYHSLSAALSMALSAASRFSVIIQLMTFMKLYWFMLVVVLLIGPKGLISFFFFLSYFSSSFFSTSVYSSSLSSFNLTVMNHLKASLYLGGLYSLIMYFYDERVLSHTCVMSCMYMLGLLIMLIYSDESDKPDL